MSTRKALAVFSFFAVTLAFALSPTTAFAQNAKVEAAAKALQKKAMDEDYLATEFAKGQDKLDKAVASCGADKCSASLRATLRRDLGVIQIGGQLDKEKGIGNFVEAMKLDPAVALDPDLRTKDLDAAWAEAKKRGGGGGSKPGPAAPTGGQPTGDFVHEPTLEQQVRTPVPIYAEYSGEEQLVKVIVRYKGFGMTDWKPLELKKMGEKGWAGLLPCADVQQGTTQYYIQGFNAENDPVAVGGDRNNAYKVKIATEKVAEPPHLPGQPAPTQCADTGDCPPNFPGCKKNTAVVGPTEPTGPTGKDGGEFCEDDTECKSRECKASKCTEPKKKSAYKKIWIGLSVGFDYQFVPSADDVCKLSSTKDGQLPLNSSNYYCVDGSGGDYPLRQTKGVNDPRDGENERLISGRSDKVVGGGAFGNVRILGSFDYALNTNVLLGLRAGVALNNYPGHAARYDGKAFPLLHLELRGTYLIGQDAITKPFAPFVMIGAGVSTFEAAVKVAVAEQPNIQKDVDAWHLAGPAFVAPGGGVRIAFSQRAALMLGLKLNFAFGNAFAFAPGPELGVVFGF